MSKTYKLFRDTIHGFIEVSDQEADIIDTLPFQRLRRIKQLGMSYLVFQGAEHSRFGHSLGVMHIATKIIDTIWRKDKEKLIKRFKWEEKDFQKNRQLLRLATLLHDIGHGPFSHASEDLFDKEIKNHEKYTELIILTEPIKTIIEKHYSVIGISPQNVVDVINKDYIEAPLLQEMLSGNIDVDKMDYLLRDSLNVGVHYGKYDIDRLINTLTIDDTDQPESPCFMIEEGGFHAAEQLFLARYWMFAQVYFHPVVKAYEKHLDYFLKGALDGSKYPKDVNEYLEYDDIKILSMLKEKKELPHANNILMRNHYRLIDYTKEHADDKEIKEFDLKIEKIKKDIDGKDYFITQSWKDKEKEEKEYEKPDFRVMIKGSKPELIITRSKIINNLEPLHQKRLYINGKYTKEAYEGLVKNGK